MIWYSIETSVRTVTSLKETFRKDQQLNNPIRCYLKKFNLHILMSALKKNQAIHNFPRNGKNKLNYREMHPDSIVRKKYQEM